MNYDIAKWSEIQRERTGFKERGRDDESKDRRGETTNDGDISKRKGSTRGKNIGEK